MWTWVDSDSAVRELVACVSAQQRYALDTEFHRERTYFPDLALIQIAWIDEQAGSDGGERSIALIDPRRVDVSLLAPLLDSPAVAVLHAAAQDLEILYQECGTIPRVVFDTQLAAGFVGAGLPSLANLVRLVIGRDLPKGDRLTDWSARPLSDDQQAYAASDVMYLFTLHDWLLDRLTQQGRQEWFEQETADVAANSRKGVAPVTDAWRKLKDAKSLRGPTRAVACEVAAWREHRARHLNLVPKMVMSDLAVLAIAHKRPTTEAQLHAVRGLDVRAMRGGVVAEVLAAVARGMDGPVPAGFAENGDTLDKRLVPLVPLAQAMVGQLARDLGIEVSLLATRSDLQRAIRGELDGRLAEGWRAEVVARPLQRLAAGELCLAYDPAGRLLLERRGQTGPATPDLAGATAATATTTAGAAVQSSPPQTGTVFT